MAMIRDSARIDYVTVSASYGIGSGSITLGADGYIYVSGGCIYSHGMTLGKLIDMIKHPNFKNIDYGIRVGRINQLYVSNEEIGNFLAGSSWTVEGGFDTPTNALQVAETWSNGTTSTEVGWGKPGVSVGYSRAKRWWKVW